ncbi:hypothetical protein E5E97_20010 [Aeromonas sp. 2692-1]|uniref:hypothetical protein n=1 Tax=Aeromonas sp. 2692-1 TaxID=2560029 RepID=UPI00148B1C21|nr:hypothetical protein [Aeromonas sp. 2692-1]QJT14969.1 hypothetical protein E5E97_20010 [Aeromonas sp. 2692-1]
MKNLTPEVIKQLALAQLLADQSEDQGTEFEDGSYEQGVRDAMGWMCGLLDNPPYNPDEWPVTEQELAIMTEGLGLVGQTEVDRYAACKHCLGTRVEFGVNGHRPCGFCSGV